MKSKSIKKKIAIFQSDLKMGGIQKSLINLFNYIDYDKYEIDLYLIDLDSFYEHNLPDQINIVKFQNLSRIERFIPFEIARKVFKTRYAYLNAKSYHTVIDFNGYQPATALAALSTKSDNKIMWVHGNIKERLVSDRAFRMNWLLQKAKVSQFDRLVAVSVGLAHDIQSLYPSSKVSIVNNIIDTDTIFRDSIESVPGVMENTYNLVSVGRLTTDKNVGESLDVLKKVLEIRNDIHLYVIGDGIEKGNLLTKSRSLGISNHVTFLGAHKNPYPYIKNMDGYISTSKHEGQGISILEAKSLGLDIYIPMHLEAYSYDIVGRSDLVRAISSAVKPLSKLTDPLTSYNKHAIKAFYELIN